VKKKLLGRKILSTMKYRRLKTGVCVCGGGGQLLGNFGQFKCKTFHFFFFNCLFLSVCFIIQGYWGVDFTVDATNKEEEGKNVLPFITGILIQTSDGGQRRIGAIQGKEISFRARPGRQIAAFHGGYTEFGLHNLGNFNKLFFYII
jgi:hypothetical protein